MEIGLTMRLFSQISGPLQLVSWSTCESYQRLAVVCRAIVIMGAGGTFSAGVDLRDPLFADASLMNEAAFHGPKNIFWHLRQVQVPLIAAVAGACITGGMELALNCDIIIASNTAFFQDTHTRYGIVPAAGMTSLLPKAIGLHAAKWMSLTGARVPAQRAHDLGLVAKVGVLHDFGVLSSFPVQMGWTRHHNQMSACHV